MGATRTREVIPLSWILSLTTAKSIQQCRTLFQTLPAARSDPMI